jgi:hypothetical protein
LPGALTEITEITTALGMLAASLPDAIAHRPAQLANVPSATWASLVAAYLDGRHHVSFATAFANGQAFLAANDALRGRPPLIAEWKGPHQQPGDDVIPADFRIDHVYLVSCKYLSKVLLNPGPARLFERRLAGEVRSSQNWFATTAPDEFQSLYNAARSQADLDGLPGDVNAVSRAQRMQLKEAFSARAWPTALQAPWHDLCQVVARESSARWARSISSPRERLRLLWRLLRISGSTYFVLGTDKTAHLRLRVDSAWDWMQHYELLAFTVSPRNAGQPEFAWRANVAHRASGAELPIDGHVEIRWSHGRFAGSPEAKVYLDTPLAEVPGYHPLA